MASEPNQPSLDDDDEVEASPFQFVEVAPRRMTLSQALEGVPERQDDCEDDDDTISVVSSASSFRPMTSLLTAPAPATAIIPPRTVLVKGKTLGTFLQT
jgi:hypothetical protein